MKEIKSYMSSQKIFFYVMFLLIIGLFSIKLYFPNVIFWIFSLIVIVYTLTRVIINKKDPFGFLLILFFLSHFSYLENQGGLWNISAFIVYIFLILFKQKEISFKTDRISSFLLISLLLVNLIGWGLYSDASIILRIQGFVMLCSYMLTYVFVSNLKLTLVVLKRFFNLLFIISIYLFFAAINQRFGLIDISLPFLPAKSISNGIISLTTNSDSTIGNSELYGEYCTLILILVLAISKSRKAIKLFFKKKYYPIVIISLMILGTLLSGSRASLVLAFFVLVFTFSLSFFDFKKSNNLLKLFGIFVIIGVIFISTNSDFGISSSINDLEKIDAKSFSLQSFFSGEAINRYELFSHALLRLNSESWIIGKGLGPIESNILAWWGYNGDTPYVDFHNLYYTLPMIYGYIGMFIFLFLVLRVIVLSFKENIKIKKFNYLSYILNAIPLFWMIFLIDEWKISMLRNSNYHMIIWIFLGLSMALIKTKKYKT
jgi:hypothetical protein